MDQLFKNAISFNQPIGSWDTSSVMFYGAQMHSVFYNAKDTFDQDISQWDTSNVQVHRSMGGIHHPHEPTGAFNHRRYGPPL